MSDLTIEEKVYLIECFYGRGKIYANAYRGFCIKCGSKGVASENTLKRIIDNFVTCGTLHDRKHDLPGPPCAVTTEETIEDIAKYFETNPNSFIRKAAHVLGLKRENLWKIVENMIKLHLYKLTMYQLLNPTAMGKRIQFCNTSPYQTTVKTDLTGDYDCRLLLKGL
ncbi:PREDICTED: uncharacterized protein LOC106745195 [Dinoponera quadriceps]|uniref:Uncharacterized protein LOC106745195 n=1 Tax=Dinoponera quadriceps TaxID=609295 RepID=A0A6P3XCE1_DINQU|nr:PREDICTED: uncharacterized protein LOC106745195 [Dinoponera quadriceps]